MSLTRRDWLRALALTAPLCASTAGAQTPPLAMNVSITFPPPIPDTRLLRQQVQQRFSGNYVADGISPSNTYEALERAAKRVAAGPQLDNGQSVYAILVRSDRILFDPLVDPAVTPGPELFRPVYVLGGLPLAVAVGRSLAVNSLDELSPLARSRAQAGRPLLCKVARGAPTALAKRMARLMSTELMLEVSPSHPHAHQMAEDARTEVFLAPLSPLLSARAAENKLRILSILAPVDTIRRLQALVGATADLGDRAVSGPFESLRIEPTSTVFVSRDEKDAVVRRLHEAWAAAFAGPEPALGSAYLRLDGVEQFSGMSARFDLEKSRLQDLARRA